MILCINLEIQNGGISRMIKEIVMDLVSSVAIACASMVSNLTCIILAHQEKEPESVQKLRKF